MIASPRPPRFTMTGVKGRDSRWLSCRVYRLDGWRPANVGSTSVRGYAEPKNNRAGCLLIWTVVRKRRLLWMVKERFTSFMAVTSPRHGIIEAQEVNSRALSAVIARGIDFDNIPTSVPGLCNMSAGLLPGERIQR